MSIHTRREVSGSRVHVWQMLKSQVLHKSSLMSLGRSVWNAPSQVAEGTHPAKRKEASTRVAFLDTASSADGQRKKAEDEAYYTAELFTNTICIQSR